MLRTILQAYRAAYGGLSHEVWILSIAMLINRTGSMVLAFLALYLTNRLGFSMSAAGLIFSVYGLGSIAGAYLGGRLIRPLGAVRTQIVGLILAMPCCLMIPLFSSWSGIAAAVFLTSLFSEAVRPASNVAIAQFTPPEFQTRAYGLQRMAINLGFSIGPAIGGFLAEIDFVWLFIVDGISTGLGGLFLISQFGFRRYSKNSSAAEKQRSAEINQNSGSPFSDKPFLCFLGLIILVMLVFFQFTATYPKYMQDHYELTKPQIGGLFAVNTVIIVVFEMLFLNVVRRFSLLRMIGWGCFLLCLGFGILPWGTTIWWAILAMVVMTFGEMLFLPLATGYVAERSAGRDQGLYMSWYAMTFSIGAVFAPMLGSSIYQHNQDLIWYFSIAIGVVVWAGFYCLLRRLNKAEKLA